MRSALRIGVIGARGHVGQDLLQLLRGHRDMDIALASSRKLAGERVFDDERSEQADLRFVNATAADVHDARLDAVVLALPNDMCRPFADALRTLGSDAVLLDLSSDHRFVDDWVYGSPERNAAALQGAKSIANPGCYATAVQLALAPFVDVLDGVPSFFGVSGYSGAGTTPSRKNDADVLRDNLLAYKLTGHTHEREVARHLQTPLRFSPHVASFFRGIHVTAHLPVTSTLTPQDVEQRLQQAYANAPFVDVTEGAPEVKDIAGTHLCRIGGAELHQGTLALVSVVDNLLKGAASQAVQNLNLAFGLDETLGLQPKTSAS